MFILFCLEITCMAIYHFIISFTNNLCIFLVLISEELQELPESIPAKSIMISLLFKKKKKSK